MTGSLPRIRPLCMGLSFVLTDTEEAKALREETLSSPFSNYLARKRPNWQNMDKSLYHKLVKTKTSAIWEDIRKQKPDLRLNSIISILVRSALDSSAAVPERNFETDDPERKAITKQIKTESLKIKGLMTMNSKS